MRQWVHTGCAVAALLTTSLAAQAADIAKPVYKAPPPAAPVYSWTGFYVGGGVGYSAYTTINRDFTLAGAPLGALDYSSGAKGWLGTIVVGYDYQFADRWVAGVFADYDFTRIDGVHDNPNITAFGTMKQKSAWAVGGRIGYLVTPDTMLYATAGYTEADFGGVNYVFGLGPFFPTGFQNGTTYDGWFVGLGAETQLARNWYGRLEYRYAGYGAQRATVFDPTGVPSSLTEIEPTVQTIRVGLSYKFGSPVAANAPVYKAPVATPAYSWTGFFIGGGVGYGAYTTEDQFLQTFTGTVGAGPYSTGGKGWLGTVIAGYDYQFADRWIVGVFADYDFTDIKGEHNNPAPWVGTLKQKSAWAVGGRLGYLMTPSTLLYVTGGYTAADFSGINFSTVSRAAPTTFQNGVTYDGWFVGLGAETQLTANWYARLEYRYADYKAERAQIFTLAGLPRGFDTNTEPTVQTIRAGLSYKFDVGKGPVIAKY